MGRVCRGGGRFVGNQWLATRYKPVTYGRDEDPMDQVLESVLNSLAQSESACSGKILSFCNAMSANEQSDASLTHSPKANRPFNLWVSLIWSIFSTGPKSFGK